MTSTSCLRSGNPEQLSSLHVARPAVHSVWQAGTILTQTGSKLQPPAGFHGHHAAIAVIDIALHATWRSISTSVDSNHTNEWLHSHFETHCL
jgi:hypothetical protein